MWSLASFEKRTALEIIILISNPFSNFISFLFNGFTRTEDYSRDFSCCRPSFSAILGVPTMWRDMLDLPNLKSYDLSSLRYGLMGGAPCPVELITEIQEKIGIQHFTVSTILSTEEYFSWDRSMSSQQNFSFQFNSIRNLRLLTQVHTQGPKVNFQFSRFQFTYFHFYFVRKFPFWLRCLTKFRRTVYIFLFIYRTKRGFLVRSKDPHQWHYFLENDSINFDTVIFKGLLPLSK